jgi:glutamyl/glutaminyl-tRNA synthetase
MRLCIRIPMYPCTHIWLFMHLHVRTRLVLEKQRFVAGTDFGDFLIWRNDGYPSYELAVVVDDLDMGITEVVRGQDLLLSTARQLLIYEALGVSADKTPQFYHCPLVTDPETGRRLSKTDRSKALRVFRAEGMSVEDLLQRYCSHEVWSGESPNAEHGP